MSTKYSYECGCCSNEFCDMSALMEHMNKDHPLYEVDFAEMVKENTDRFVDEFVEKLDEIDETEEGFLDYCHNNLKDPLMTFLKMSALVEGVSLDDKIKEFYDTHLKFNDDDDDDEPSITA